jgi:putative heme-binding domain-containing protein
MDVRKQILIFCVVVCGAVMPQSAWSQGDRIPMPFWIWSPEHTQSRVPQESCYFRKEVVLPSVQGGEIDIAADDEFELYLNGRLAGTGGSWEEFTTLDVTDFLKPGKNVIAIKVTNLNGGTAGVAARLRPNVGLATPRVYLTNPTWRTSLSVLPMWNRPRYRDSRWEAAQNFGAYGEAELWKAEEFQDSKPVESSEQLALNKPSNGEASGDDVINNDADEKEKGASASGTQSKNAEASSSRATVAANGGKQNVAQQETVGGERVTEKGAGSEGTRINLPQFDVMAGFRIEHVLGGDETGSLISATFNEFGQMLAGREGGPLLMLYDTNDNNIPDAVRVCCDKVENCQGIVCVSGRVFVTAEGPDGVALYRLEDQNHDGTYENVTAIVQFEGKSSEHGPHGISMGLDGLLYLVVGNYTKIKSDVSESSPYGPAYEGDLLQPRYEDPRGHAKGMAAPGGAILRCRQDGRDLEVFAGGLRNCYDLEFHPTGDLFTHDSDMETDEGTPWHRPTRFSFLPAGAELGWRSGWAKWPEYWVDSLPATMLTGRGSPTGLAAYDHTSYPPEFRDAIFSCDWAQGQINVIRLSKAGAGYTAETEPFLRGKPLNVTDIVVGPEGWLYFVTGGRGTAGHVFRVVWQGEDEKALAKSVVAPKSVAEAVNYPQFSSAWARQAISMARQSMGSKWDAEMRRYVENPAHSGRSRARALEIMHLIGPPPTDQLLIRLSSDPDAALRSRAAYYLGLIGNPAATARLTELLEDSDGVVRRFACEGLARKEKPVSWDALAPLLRSADRYETWAARRLLEKNDDQDWLEQALAEPTPHGFVQGATAWLIAKPTAVGATRVLERVGEYSAGFVSDADFVDMLRLMQLAMIRGQLAPDDVKPVTGWLEPEFPAGNPLITRELATLLAYIQPTGVTQRMLEYARSTDVAQEDRVHTATRLRFLQTGWTTAQKMELILLLEEARKWEGGSNLAKYMEAIQLDFVKTLAPEDHRALLVRGESVPQAALATLFALPEQPDDDTIDELADLYARIPNSADESYHRLRVGIVAVLGTKASEKSMAYLRAIYDTDPDRRQEVAMALAQQPDGRNWDYLVRSIPSLEGAPAREVLQKLQTVPYAPESPEYLRQLIIAGLRLDEEESREADALLTYWSQRPAADSSVPLSDRFARWQSWFAERYPDQQPAALPEDSERSVWTVEDLVAFLESPDGQGGSLERGAKVFREAQCVNCHRFDREGTTIGPDLTTVVYRFQRREILESIIHPSQVISDQYASHSIGLKDGRTLTGLLVPGETGKVNVVQPDGKTAIVNELDIDELAPSQVSAMPEGLLNALTLEEIRDLFSFLNSASAPEIAQGEAAVKR